MKKIALMGIFAVIFFAGCAQQTPKENLDTFAQCLTDNGAVMYGSVTCSHCQDQKKMFGESFEKINYVECTQEFARCSTLKGVPTWEFKDGSQLEGFQELSVLANKTNCTLP
ncbi:MAG TPA: hypothetical protein PKC87_03040 [Candidatus Absconditabacterales bacterium]|nr:hypothetical protein [Candidatus Absconditabacterales bacterium]